MLYLCYKCCCSHIRINILTSYKYSNTTILSWQIKVRTNSSRQPFDIRKQDYVYLNTMVYVYGAKPNRIYVLLD